jgi:hypothetical protein
LPCLVGENANQTDCVEWQKPVPKNLGAGIAINTQKRGPLKRCNQRYRFNGTRAWTPIVDMAATTQQVIGSVANEPTIHI